MTKIIPAFLSVIFCSGVVMSASEEPEAATHEATTRKNTTSPSNPHDRNISESPQPLVAPNTSPASSSHYANQPPAFSLTVTDKTTTA